MAVNYPVVVNSLENSIAGLEKDNQIKDDKINSLEKSITDLTSRLAQGKEEADTHVAKLRKEHEEQMQQKERIISELNNSISKIEIENKTIKEENSNNRDKILKMEMKIHELEGQITRNDTEVEPIKIQFDKVQEEIKAKEKSLKDRYTEIDELKLKIESLNTISQNVTSAKDEEIEKYKTQVDTLQKLVQTKEDFLTQKETLINDLNNKIGEMTVEIENLNNLIPKKPVLEEADEIVKGAQCPRCGMSVFEEYKIDEGKRTLIKKYCPNTSCGWTVSEKQKIECSLDTRASDDGLKELKMFRVEKNEVKEVNTLDSKSVIIIADPKQETIWIWKGAESDRFEYVQATSQSSIIKNEVMKKPHVHIERVEDGKEPKHFPNIKK